ncbi:MAG: hypothetical protein KAH20_08410 [Methylococcales bacterium]|nr:hypothetical protein [Methylococcales bacterium]
MIQPCCRNATLVYQQSCVKDELEEKTAFYIWLMAVVVLISIAIVIFFWLGGYTRKNHVEGFLNPDQGVIKTYPQQVNTLIGLEDQEKVYSRRGKLLFLLSIDYNLLELANSHIVVIKELRNRSGVSKLEIGRFREKKMIYYEKNQKHNAFGKHQTTYNPFYNGMESSSHPPALYRKGF